MSLAQRIDPQPIQPRWAAWRHLPLALILAIAGLMALHGPIVQLAHYHDFADQRTWLGIPCAADVLSNFGFALVGLLGLAGLWRHRHSPALAAGWPGYALFLAGLVLTACGSAFYHLAPDDARLQWDRLPIALVCAGLLVAVRGETRPDVDVLAWLVGLIAAAILSVAWWTASAAYGQGDLRPYLLLQIAPLLLVPLWQAMHGTPTRDRRAFGLAILLYIAAKATELLDHQLLALLGGLLSGHSLKHLLATLAAAVLVHRLWRRVMGADRVMQVRLL